MIEADRYRLACQRYIELNPVRASIVSTPGDYPWSSYRANALGGADPILTPHSVYRELAPSEEVRRGASVPTATPVFSSVCRVQKGASDKGRQGQERRSSANDSSPKAIRCYTGRLVATSRSGV